MSGLVYLAQFFIITSIGLSLGAIVMGFNSKVDEELAELQQTPIECLEYVGLYVYLASSVYPH